MNDDARLERLFADGLHELAPRRAPERLRTRIKTGTDEMEPRPRWLALVMERPMRTNSRLAVGSPTARVVAIMAATLLLALLAVSAGIAGSQVLGDDGLIVVDQSGGGDFTAIQAAVDAAAEGDEIAVRPGTYVEAIIIDKGITLAGDGPREDVVISAPEDGPTVTFGAGVQALETAYALLLDDAQAEVRGLTFAGAGTTVVVDGGSPTLSDLVFDGNRLGLLIGSGSTATFSESLMTGGGGIEMADYSEPLIAGNVLRGGPSIVGAMGDGGVVRDNVLVDPVNGIALGGVGQDEPTHALIERNTIAGAGGYAISTATLVGAGAPVIRDNTISGSRSGIQVGSTGGDTSDGDGTAAAIAQPLVSGNDISAELIAISVTRTDASVVENIIHGSFNGIVLAGGGSAEVIDNEVQVDGVGIDIGANTSPTVDGNSACGGSASIRVHDTATPSMGENTTCDAT